MNDYRAGFIGIVGEPNAGKSTLMNAVLGEKASIVSAKPQTTRRRVHGILTLPKLQAVFVDAPGLLNAKAGLNGFLADEARAVARDSDGLIGVLAADSSDKTAALLVKFLKDSGKPWRLLVSKADVLGADRGPKALRYLLDENVSFVSITAMRRPEEAKEEVLSAITEMLPPSPAPLYDEELYTTQTIREIAAEIVRERCFEAMRHEIPYGLAVKTVQFKENEGGFARISCEIWVEKDSHKAIVIGAKGSSLKQIGTESREAIEKLVGRRAYLELRVVAKPGWSRNPVMMKELGYVVPE